MKIVSNDIVADVIKELLIRDYEKKNFDKLNTRLNKKKNLGDKIKYYYVYNRIKEMSEDERNTAYTNAEKSINLVNGSEVNDILMQILNHIILEVPRALEYDSIKNQSSNFSETIRDYRSELRSQMRDSSKKANKLEDKISGMQSEIVTILGIFSAIILAFFGGIQVLGAVIGGIERKNFYILIIVALVVGLVMFNIIYMLLYTISKLINKNIGIIIDKNKCNICDHNSKYCLRIKYPIVYWFNFISIASVLLMLVIYNLDRYGVFRIIFNSLIWMIENNAYVRLITTILFITAFTFLICYVFKKYLIDNKISMKCICNDSNNSNEGCAEDNNTQEAFN